MRIISVSHVYPPHDNDILVYTRKHHHILPIHPDGGSLKEVMTPTCILMAWHTNIYIVIRKLTRDTYNK